MKAQTVDFRKYYGQVSGSVQTALFNSFLAFILIISATVLWIYSYQSDLIRLPSIIKPQTWIKILSYLA